jgi:hypothetical protein
MKRLLLLLSLIILLLAAGGGACWWLLKKKSAETPIVSSLPADIILYAHIPDGTASYNRYQQSNLKKVVESPELKFLKSWVLSLGESKLNPSQKEGIDKTQELVDLLARNLDGESFVAVMPIDLKNFKGDGLKELPVVLGLRPKEGKAGLNALIGKFKELLGKELEDAPRGNGEHGGINYTWIDCPREVRICQGHVGDWEVTTLSEPTLHMFIDRYQKKINSPSLADSAPYQTLRSRLGAEEDAFAYVNFQSAFEMVRLALSDAAIPQEMLTKMLDQSRFLSAVGLSVRFRQNQIEDTLVALAPKATRPDLGRNYDPCAYQTMQFTSAETLVYFAQNLDAHKQYDYLLKTYQDTAPESYKSLTKFNETVASTGLDLNRNLLDAIGPEVGFALEWPRESPLPEAGLFVEIAHPDDFKPVMDLLVKNVEPLTESTNDKEGKPISPVGMLIDSQMGPYQLKTFKFTKSIPLSPTVATGNNFFALFLTETGAHRALEKQDGSTVKDSPGYKTSGASLGRTSSFIFVDMSRLTDRLYEAAKPYYGMALAFSPDLQATLKNFRLPASLGFTQPMGSWTLSTQVDDEAFTMHSQSGIGTPIFPFMLLGGTAAALTKPAVKMVKAEAKNVSASAETDEESTRGTDLEATSVTQPATPATLAPVTTSTAPIVAPAPLSPPSRPTDPTADEVREQLEELRTIVDAWIAEEKVANGTPVSWSSLARFLIKDSALEKTRGLDAFGTPYVLGVVGGKTCDLDESTKARFPDKDPSYWAPVTER